MSIPWLRRTAGALLMTTVVSLSARGALTTVDQQNAGFSSTYFYGGSTSGAGVGQTFTPATVTLNAADFTLEAANNKPVTMRLDLFSGAGYGGTLLASSGSIVLSSLTAITQEFAFSLPVAVVAGSVYSFRLTTVSVAAGGGYAVMISPTNTYAAGSEIDTAGALDSTEDLFFAEGTAVPEPSSLALAAAGLAGLGLRWRARRA